MSSGDGICAQRGMVLGSATSVGMDSGAGDGVSTQAGGGVE